MTPVKIIAAIFLCFLPIISMALSTDSDQPINIEADNLEIDDTRHISIYQGNVDMKQGSLHIQADRIIFHFNETNDLQRLEINGTPATFNQLNERQQAVTGSALQMNYYEKKSLMELQGMARFQNDRDTIESEYITINTATDALQAGDQQGKGRVRMLIQPNGPQN